MHMCPINLWGWWWWWSWWKWWLLLFICWEMPGYSQQILSRWLHLTLYVWRERREKVPTGLGSVPEFSSGSSLKWEVPFRRDWSIIHLEKDIFPTNSQNSFSGPTKRPDGCGHRFGIRAWDVLKGEGGDCWKPALPLQQILIKVLHCTRHWTWMTSDSAKALGEGCQLSTPLCWW